MLYTIGYESLDASRFVQELRQQNIHVLIDVRELPLSRKRGFSKSALDTLVTAAGVKYVHLRDLGAPREVRHKLRATGDWDEYCLGYQAHLEQQDVALAAVAELASEENVCLMCFEADYRECHRSLIADELQQQGKIDAPVHLNPQTARRAVA